METAAKEYFDALHRLELLKKDQETVKSAIDRAHNDLRLKRDAFKNLEYDIITK